MVYRDMNGKEIKAGMYLFVGDGHFEKVYACGDGDLGINASNDDYMKAHGMDECEREFFPLSAVGLKDAMAFTEAELRIIEKGIS